MKNLLSYCGLVDARISASEKDLPLRIDLNQYLVSSYIGCDTYHESLTEADKLIDNCIS